MLEGFRHTLALPSCHKFVIWLKWWSFCLHVIGELGQREKNSLPKVAASPLRLELMSSKPKCFNLMIQFSLDAQSDISFQSLTLHTRTDLFSFMIVNLRVTLKCSGWFSTKWFFRCSARCTLICPIHPNTCLILIKWIFLSVYVPPAFTQNMHASVQWEHSFRNFSGRLYMYIQTDIHIFTRRKSNKN